MIRLEFDLRPPRVKAGSRKIVREASAHLRVRVVLGDERDHLAMLKLPVSSQDAIDLLVGASSRRLQRLGVPDNDRSRLLEQIRERAEQYRTSEERARVDAERFARAEAIRARDLAVVAVRAMRKIDPHVERHRQQPVEGREHE